MTKDITSHINRVPEYSFVMFFFIYSFFPSNADAIKLLCLSIIVCCWIVRMIAERRILFSKTSINIPILSLLICSLMASFYSLNIKYSLETILHDHFMYFTIFFGMVNTIRSQEQIKRLVKAMLITCGLVCAYGLYGYYTGIAIREERLVATFGYHTLISAYISFLLPFIICFFFWCKNLLKRLCLGLLLLVCSFSLILTMARASWVAVFVAVFFIGFVLKKKSLILVPAGICALLIFILPSKFISHAKTVTQINKYFNSKEILGERLLCWKASVAMIKDYPLLGIGPGERNFRYAYQQYGEKIKNEELQQINMKDLLPSEAKKIKKILTQKVQRLSNSHNIFLHVCVETGIVGLLIFLWLFSLVFYSIIKLWRSLNLEYEKMLLVGITASLISFFIQGLVHNLWKKPEAIFLWYIISILFVVIHSTSRQNEIPQLTPPLKDNTSY